jgi:methyl-accepting chemotaxis protein
MAILNNLRIGMRLTILVGLLLCLIAVVLGLGLRGMGQINASLKTVYEDRTVCIVQLGAIERDFFRIRVHMYGLLSAHSPDDITKAKAEMASLQADASKQWADYTSTYIDPVERQYVTGYEKALPDYIAVRDRVLDLLAAGDVDAAAHKMSDMSQSMSSIAVETERQGTVVSAATEEASANVSTISSTANELTASIQEIATQVNRSADIAAEAVAEVRATNQTMESLSHGADRIGEVVNLINDIASQTNLLALNATIEAARAGEAGKGFAVVANEVKHLANQTAKATGEIAQQIQGIQGETREAVEAMGRITAVINQINEMSSAIASAIEEQGAAIQEVARNVDQAAQGTREVASNITQVVEAAGHTGTMAVQVQTAAGMLTGESDKLRHSVESFLSGVKAA